MTVALSPPPYLKLTDANNLPLAGGLLYTYAAGTTTPVATYTDGTGGTPNANPVVLDSFGQASVWLTAGQSYKFVLKSALGVTQWTQDNVIGAQASGYSASIAASGGSALVGWIRSAVSAVASTVAAWIGWRAVSPLEFMSDAMRADVTTGALAMDHTAAVQAAINTGKTVDLLGYYYKVNNLTQNTTAQSVVSTQGVARLVKNANGPILTSSADDFSMENVTWRGDASSPTFTGDGVVATGQRPGFLNCGGQWISGVPLRATGGRVRVKGCATCYQTSDTTSTGYDIVIGVSGTATLYHELDEIYSSQATGGIHLIDTGSHTIKGGQFGKLFIDSGTSPAGSNGGKTLGARILGNVTVELSSAIFAANQFSAVAVTFAVGTSGCRLDISNVFENGATVTNNGNANNFIEREVSAGGTTQIKYGDDAAIATVTIDTISGDFTQPGNFTLPNNKALKIKDSGGTAYIAAYMSGSSNWQFGDNVGAGSNSVQSGSGGVYLGVAGASIMQAYSGGIRPGTDNTLTCGHPSQRFSVVYAGTGAINTSDARLKQQVRSLSDAERAVAVRIKGSLRAFKFNEAVQAKAEKARIHIGVIAQEVADAFKAEGLDPLSYSLFCHDAWDDMPEVFDDTQEQPEVLDGNGKVLQPHRPAQRRVIHHAIPAGDRYGIRYEELLAFVLAAI